MIPARLRFQGCSPFPSSAPNGFKANFAADYPDAERFSDVVVPNAAARVLNGLHRG